MAGGKLEKAYMYNEDRGSVAFTCLFNPASYTFSKQNSWSPAPLTSSDVPAASFQGGGHMTMHFEIFFDTYANQTDVRNYTDELLRLMLIDDSLTNPSPTQQPSGGQPAQKSASSSAPAHRPPTCSFHWGNSWSFKGVLTGVRLDFTLFTNQGMPVRAKATVDMRQVEPEGKYQRQNPTSGGVGTHTSRLIEPGDTLDLIAHQVYGDSTLWRVLAQANRLENPRALRPGQRLIVP